MLSTKRPTNKAIQSKGTHLKPKQVRREEDTLRPHVAPPRQTRGPRRARFVSQVLASVNRAAHLPASMPSWGQRRRGAKNGRGAVAAQFAGPALSSRSRRVVVKTRLVARKLAAPGSLGAHLRYVAREGVSPDGGPARAYGPAAGDVDLERFDERARDGRHHFRFIVAPEDGAALGELRGFTRELMRRAEADVGTPLDWVAIDHWDTGKPHTHIVLRGQDSEGNDLVIDREYISHGLRRRACELATEWLGERTEREIRASMCREVEEERWTGLDRQLQAFAQDGVLDVRGSAGASPSPGDELLLKRLRRLELLGLAQMREAGVWQLRQDWEALLRAAGERGDIVRLMRRTFTTGTREVAIFDAQRALASVTGRLVAKGMLDELSDTPYVVIDAVDGRAHYVRLPAGTHLLDIPKGAIVEARPTGERATDRNIVALANDGIYRTEHHLQQLRVQRRGGVEPEETIQNHVRRLEALRRAGIVDRVADGVWRVPPDLVARGHAYDRRRRGGIELVLHCPLAIDKQTSAQGATWLDRQLVAHCSNLATTGFGAEVRTALEARKDVLLSAGLAVRHGQQVIFARDLLDTLRARELEAAARSIAEHTGLAHHRLVDGGRAARIYRRSLMLSSGRFAILEDGQRFSLVPWRPVIEGRLGQHLSAAVRGDHVNWTWARQLSR